MFRDLGVKTIVISGIIARDAGMKIERRRRKVNTIIESLCKDHSFTYISNENINTHDICEDRVHLQDSGTKKVANNIIDVLNGKY